MAIEKKTNINENQVVFRRDAGHSHDGLGASLIDYKRYSIFDFVPYPVASPNSSRRVFEENNVRSFKTFIVSAVEERVLNPKGIRVQANAITAREIVAGTITANELSSNVILVNNIIRSNTFNGSFDNSGNISNAGTTGWAISYSGASVFNNVTVRGTILSSTISGTSISGGTISGGEISGGSISIGSGSPAPFRVLANGQLIASGASISGVLTANANSTIGPLSVQSTQVLASWDNKIVSLFTDNVWGGGGSVENYIKIGVGAKEPSVSLSLFTSRGLYVYASDTPPLWGSYSTVTSLTKGLLAIANGRRATFSTSSTESRISFFDSTNQISNKNGDIYADDNGLYLARSAGTSKLLFFAQNADIQEYVGIGRPIAGAGGSGWETLYWNNAFGTIGRSGSSIRYKENVQSLGDVGHIIDQLRPVSFVRKTYGEPTAETEAMRLADIQYGFIAEEVLEIDNGHLSIIQEKDGELIAEDWRNRDMIAVLVKEVQNLRLRVLELEGKPV